MCVRLATGGDLSARVCRRRRGLFRSVRAQLDCLNHLLVCWLWYVVSNGCTAPHCADIVVMVVCVSGSRPSQGGGMYGPAPRVSHTPPRPPEGEECLSCVGLEDVCLHASCRVVLLVTRAVAGGVEYHPSRVPTKIKMDCDGEYTKYSS